MNIGRKLKALREEKPKLTTRKVSEETGISHTTITRYEKGQIVPSDKNLRLLADFYKVSVSELTKITKSDNSTENDELKFSKFEEKRILNEISKLDESAKNTLLNTINRFVQLQRFVDAGK